MPDEDLGSGSAPRWPKAGIRTGNQQPGDTAENPVSGDDADNH